jgi:hypothetical protein
MQDLLTKGIDEAGNVRSEETHEFKDSAIDRIPVEWEVEVMASVLTQPPKTLKTAILRLNQMIGTGYIAIRNHL